MTGVLGYILGSTGLVSLGGWGGWDLGSSDPVIIMHLPFILWYLRRRILSLFISPENRTSPFYKCHRMML